MTKNMYNNISKKIITGGPGIRMKIVQNLIDEVPLRKELEIDRKRERDRVKKLMNTIYVQKALHLL